MTRRPSSLLWASDQGTSLLELLLALALIAVMMTMITGSFGFGRRAWETADRVEVQADIEQVAAVLRRMLAEAVPTRVIDSQGRQSLWFFGEEDRVRFVINASGTVTTGGLQEVTLEARPAAGGGSDLVLKLSPYRPHETAQALETPPIEERALLSNVEAFKLKYFGPLREGDRPDWHDGWENLARLPQLIALDVKLSAGDIRRFEPLVVAPRLN